MTAERSRLIRLADEARILAEELIQDTPIEFPVGAGILRYLLARCDYCPTHITRRKGELPVDFRQALQSLMLANNLTGQDRRWALVTCLFALSTMIWRNLHQATGMADAVNQQAFTTTAAQGR